MQLNILTFFHMLSKPILTQHPCEAGFSPRPWHTNQTIASRPAGSESRGEANNTQPRMGLSCRDGRVATVLGSSWSTEAGCMKGLTPFPALMILSERVDCGQTSDPAGVQYRQQQRDRRSTRMCRAASSSQRPHYNQLRF